MISRAAGDGRVDAVSAEAPEMVRSQTRRRVRGAYGRSYTRLLEEHKAVGCAAPAHLHGCPDGLLRYVCFDRRAE